MPKILRHALRSRIQSDPGFGAFCRDFEAVTGYRVFFVDETGVGSEAVTPCASVCPAVQSTSAGCRMCLGFRLSLIQSATESGAAAGLCDAGLREGVVALRTGGMVAGFLVVGGCRPPDPAGINERRAGHLMRRLGRGLPDDAGESAGWTAELFQSARERCNEFFSAALRLLDAGASKFPEDHAGGGTDRVLPGPVQRAMRVLKSKALLGEIRLPEVARESGVSAEHLSRLFHRHTGLPFHEYVARLRIESACDRLAHGKENVTEIAFGCGFSSLSQFYRSFRKFTGSTPSKFLAARAAAPDA